ncbi:MAG TPA: hypothetical protein PLQ76_08580, partial [bacterium]|nr:hypothetical protein [bacterium]
MMRKRIFFVSVIMFMMVSAGNHIAKADGNKIAAVDDLFYDGAKMVVVYGVESGCPAGSHETELDFEPSAVKKGSVKTITELQTVITDVVDEGECTGRTRVVSIKSELNVEQALGMKLDELKGEGYVIDKEYKLTLPRVMPNYSNGKLNAEKGKISESDATPNVKPDTAIIETVSYSLAWHCNLDKHSNARRNNFDGYGAS